MTDENIYFALWANDINKYMYTAFNARKLSEVRKGLLDYVRDDDENPADIESASIDRILTMTLLQLDYNEEPFPYGNNRFAGPLTVRTGEKVNRCFLK